MFLDVRSSSRVVFSHTVEQPSRAFEVEPTLLLTVKLPGSLIEDEVDVELTCRYLHLSLHTLVSGALPNRVYVGNSFGGTVIHDQGFRRDEIGLGEAIQNEVTGPRLIVYR